MDENRLPVHFAAYQNFISVCDFEIFIQAKINPMSYRNSTFFPSWKPSVYMNDDDDDDDASSVTTMQSDDTPCVSVCFFHSSFVIYTEIVSCFVSVPR